MLFDKKENKKIYSIIKMKQTKTNNRKKMEKKSQIVKQKFS